MWLEGSRGALSLSTLSVLLVACSPSSTRTTSSVERPAAKDDGGELYLGLSAPTDGFQVRSVGTDIAPGEEREYCEAARIPGGPTDEYYVSLIDLANGPSSHHLGLAVADPGTAAEAELAALGVGNRVECTGPLLAFGAGIEIIGTIQVPHGEAELPPHVARRFFGGQYIVFDYHYANTGLETVQARSAANFHEVAPATVEHLAELYSLNNVTIDVPAGQTASFTGECHFKADMMVGAFTRHTHHLGTDFSVWHAGGAQDGTEIWTSHDWQNDTEFVLPEPELLPAGEGFRYRCTYANDTDTRLRFGTSVRDEMCMLYGPAWAAADGGQLDLPDCNITWIDDQGIGHPATEAGGFPKPNASDQSLCTSIYGGASIDDCSKCRCDSCATAGIKCAADPDCSQLFSCLGACTDVSCTEQCQPIVQAHSSGTGLFTELIECVKAECPRCDPATTASTGTL